MKQVLIVADRRFVSKGALAITQRNLGQVGIQAHTILVLVQPRPIEVYSMDNLPEATMEVFRNFIEAEAVVKEV